MTHDERIEMIMNFGSNISPDSDWKAKILFLMEELISKVEALTDRTPDFRTKGDPNHGEQ